MANFIRSGLFYPSFRYFKCATRGNWYACKVRVLITYTKASLDQKVSLQRFIITLFQSHIKRDLTSKNLLASLHTPINCVSRKKTVDLSLGDRGEGGVPFILQCNSSTFDVWKPHLVFDIIGKHKPASDIKTSITSGDETSLLLT